MKIYDHKGMMFIPTSDHNVYKVSSQLLVIKQCYCPNGHNLVHSRAMFNNEQGIVIKVKQGNTEGVIALSPVYGDKSRIAVDIDLENGALLSLMCPECNAELPVYTQCECGGNLIALFTDSNLEFTDCIGVCNRVGCTHATIKSEDEMILLANINSL